MANRQGVAILIRAKSNGSVVTRLSRGVAFGHWSRCSRTVAPWEFNRLQLRGPRPRVWLSVAPSSVANITIDGKHPAAGSLRWFAIVPRSGFFGIN